MHNGGGNVRAELGSTREICQLVDPHLASDLKVVGPASRCFFLPFPSHFLAKPRPTQVLVKRKCAVQGHNSHTHRAYCWRMTETLAIELADFKVLLARCDISPNRIHVSLIEATWGVANELRRCSRIIKATQ